MKKNRFLITMGLALGLSGAAVAAPVCNGASTCETPVATSQGSLIINAASLLGIQCLNSTGPNGNQVNSSYFFAVSNADLGATVANGGITNSGNGLTVVGVTPTHNGSALPGSTVTAGQVQGTKGGTTYFLYAQACPNGTAANGINCSQWAKVDASQVTTTAYPTSVFSAPSRPADATVNSINARTSVPAGDVSNVSVINLTIDDLINAANNQTLASITYTGNTSPYLIDNTLFTNGFKPNNKYQYTGQVQYPWDLVPIAGPQTVPGGGGAFWTTPENPGAVSASNVTHCSALITAHNSNVATPNPTYTEYSLCATGICQTTGRINGTPLSSDPISATVTGLTDNTLYTPNATALVGNQDGTQAGWNNSGQTSGSNFTTIAWGGSSSVTNITTNSANYNFPGLNTAGVLSYQVILNGISQGVVPGVPVSPILLTGLTPNKQYTVALQLSEASCTSPTILSQNFTTTPNDPTTFTLSAASPFSLNSGWATAGNPGNTVYQVQYCTDAGFTLNCQTQNSAAGATSVTLTTGVNPQTTYFAHVKALTVGGGSDSGYSNSASATTPPDVHSITIIPTAPQTINVGGFIVFTASVTDASGNKINGQTVNWSVSGGGPLSPSNPTASVTFTATTAGGPFTLTASLAGYTDATNTITVNATGPAFTTQPTATVKPDNMTGTVQAAATDQAFNATPITYTWSLESGPGAVSFGAANGTTTGGNNLPITFSKAGSYTFRCIAADNFGNVQGVTPAVVVNQILKGIKVCPNGVAGCPNEITVQTLQNQQFTANGIDQFGDPMTPSGVTWSSTGAGNINSAGVFSSAQIGVLVTVTAKSGNVSGSALVNVISFDVSGAKAFPVPYKANQGTGVIHFSGLGSQSSLRIYTSAGRRVFDLQLSADTYDWPIKNSSGESIASGVYFYVIESPTGKKNGKLIIIQ